jgi:hypothetical protein
MKSAFDGTHIASCDSPFSQHAQDFIYLGFKCKVALGSAFQSINFTLSGRWSRFGNLATGGII